MRKFIRKYYIQLTAIIILFILAVIMLSQSFSVRNMAKNKSKELKQTQLDYVLAQEFLRHEYKFKKDATYVENNDKWLSIFLPNDDDEKVQLFSTLEQLAKDTGNDNIELSVINSTSQIKQKKATKTKKKVIGDTMNIRVSLVGNYNDLIYFLQKLENMKYFADATSISVNKTVKSTPYKDEESKETLRDDLLQTNMDVIFYLDK